MAEGGLTEALARALLYVRIPAGGPDERGFAAIRRLRRDHPSARQLTLAAFKALVRDQYFMLLIDEAAALAALPKLLPDAMDERRDAFAMLREVLEARGPLGRGFRRPPIARGRDFRRRGKSGARYPRRPPPTLISQEPPCPSPTSPPSCLTAARA